MHPSLRRLVFALALTAPLAPVPAGADTFLDREFTYAPDRVRVAVTGGVARVSAAAGLPEPRAGQPDLPVIGERVALPAGQRLVRVEVTAFQTAPLAEGVDVAPALSRERGPAAGTRTAPDAAAYGATVPLPREVVTTGYQGFERGERVAWLQVRPALWNPATRRLERVTRVAVRLVLADDVRRPLARERAVPDERLARGPLAASPARTAQPFRPEQVPSVLGSPVSYLIVTADSLATAFQPLADWKTQSGVPAAVRTLGFIRQQYPSAADDPERIRLFLRDAYQRWGTQWVLLGGDTEILPSRRINFVLLSGEYPPSDLYYSCLDGNWAADGDSLWAEGYAGASNPGDAVDLLPEVWVGRAPVVTAADVQHFVQKTLSYEKTPVSDYMTRMMFFAQVITPDHWQTGNPTEFDGADLVEQDMLPILDTAPQIHALRLYQNDTNPAWRPGALHESKAVVRDSLEAGYNVAVHVGHGYREVMSCGDDNLTTDDMMRLANGSRLMNFYAIDCTSNAIDYASIGEALLRAPDGGAVTNIGSTTLDYPAYGRVYQEEYFRLLLEDSVTAVGEAQAKQKLPFVGSSYYDSFDRLSQLTLLLLGDPELRIFIGTPRELVVTAPASVTAADTAVTVHVETDALPLPGARVTVYLPGHEYRTALTDAAGDVTLPFHPDSLGTGTLTVTAFDARPWQGALDVTAPAGPALQFAGVTVRDDAADGRVGDGDGILDAGETVDVRVTLRNAGGDTATGITGSLATTDGLIAILLPGAAWPDLPAGASALPAADFRLSLPWNCPDQREIAFTLDVLADGGLHAQQRLSLTAHAPELALLGHTESEDVGNGDGRPQAGETVVYTLRLRNTGSAEARGIAGVLRNPDGLATVLDSAFTAADLAPGDEAWTTAVRFTPSAAGAKLAVLASDAGGPRLAQSLDLAWPATPTGLSGSPAGPDRIHLAWARASAADLQGYNVYRAPAPGGPFVKATPLVPGRVATLTDVGLAPFTTYWYEVASVDSSGNESAPSAPFGVTTNPPSHPGFPAYTRESTDTPVAIDHVYPGRPWEILVGGEYLHLFHSDGTWPVDADGSATTPGDFSNGGRFYAGGGSISDLDANGTREIVGAGWTSQQLRVLDPAGVPRAGFPVPLPGPAWSSVAIGDLDHNGRREMVVATLAGKIMVFRDNGTEWMDGDANPATVGVFKTVGGGFNVGTPALADLEGNGQRDIVYGGSDGVLYAWRPDGSNVPGFPVTVGPNFNGSVVVGRLDGPGGPLSIVGPCGDNTLRVYTATGAVHAGFPVHPPTLDTNHSGSPALADMNGDGYTDIVFASTNGRLYVYDRTGALVPPWTNSRFSALTFAATQSSPVIADIDGDGLNDVVVGDENGRLAGLSGATGAPLPGFPIALDAEASGTPAVCDCDGDGQTEIVDVDYGGTVHVWDYDRPYSPAGPAPWPQFQHDPERTGYSETLGLVAADGPAAAPRALELSAPRPNPARGLARIAFGVPSDRAGARLEVAVFDLAGRRVRTLASGPARAGRAEVAWDLRDDGGLPAATGVYLVRLRAGGVTLTRKLVTLR